ncbi:GIY-YIG nuclease family protein [Streptomyces sp. NPDC005863]|uniref:GIY-YIG nuclease family protein n=1 Tax=Streptomyces sp. NPDC005863 TaxID=3364735 RepID=UPI00369FEFFE
MPDRTARTAIYRLYDATDDLLYVGISINPDARFRAHRIDKPWWLDVEAVQIDWLDSRLAAEQAETEAISTESPRYNLHQTQAWRDKLAASAKAVSPEGRRRRSLGMQARKAMERKVEELIAQGLPYAEALEQGALERERFLGADLLASLRRPK